MHLHYPESQTIKDHVAHHGVVAVEGVSATGVVVVVAVYGVDYVVCAVVYALKRKRRTHFVAFGGVVKDNVQDHLDVGLVQFTHHVFEFPQLATIFAVCGIRCLWGKEGYGLISPEVLEALTRGWVYAVGVKLFELGNGQQLYGGYTKLLEVWYLFDDPGIGPRGLYL
ncbi:hypothetical protein MBAV_000076 [Candidatus Magnetobacterium bavaricum]|uniref:Uncharacterized protein n=1 Tax=Candidatus Magnetobacterium bavaricum TaxID=29290 RepID=A0A0F3H0Q8_9BACT|nr:hypothetical protein MBAV_000076 [Candidatus Magnetobacterium bavaricum]